MDTPSGKTILSGIQPSGSLHLGNYLGALKQWVELQENNTVYYCIVDLHAITVPYEPKEYQSRVLDAAAGLLAVGIDPKRSTLFAQSQVPAHAELNWLLSTTTPLGELERMTQFKDKQAKQREKSSLGLFAYPVLQAADILLYQAHAVPVGEDQVQHIELARDIAKRFNNRFADIFTLPKPYVPKGAARIKALNDPTKKMSKSDESEKSYIALMDEPDVIRKKIMGAVTETEPIFSFTESGPAVQNLLQIFAAVSGDSHEAIEKQFAGSAYKTFKEALAEVVVAQLTPIRKRYQELRADENKLKEILSAGRDQAAETANPTLAAAKEAMGFLV